MITTTESSRNLVVIKQADLQKMISSTAQATTYAVAQSEPYQGRTPLIPATIKGENELRAYFAKMGIHGDGARADFYLAAAANPSLAANFPYDGVPSSLELAETRREELKVVQPSTQQQANVVNNDKPSKKPYGANPYSYIKKALYSADYSKLPAKVYSGIGKMVKAFGRIRGVYQSSSSVLRGGKKYNGNRSLSTTGNVVSLDKYKAARIAKQYQTTNPEQTLEQKVA